MNIEINDLRHFIENSIGSKRFYVDIFDNDNEIGRVFVKSKNTNFKIEINIKNNSDIYLPTYEKVVERDFVSFKFNNLSKEINYFIVENDGKFQVYTTKCGFPKTLIKEFKNLEQEVFDFVFKEIQDFFIEHSTK